MPAAGSGGSPLALPAGGGPPPAGPGPAGLGGGGCGGTLALPAAPLANGFTPSGSSR